VHLDVGSGGERACAKEPSGIAGADREQSLSEQRVTQPGAGAMRITSFMVIRSVQRYCIRT
jgi:hypothetical protein